MNADLKPLWANLKRLSFDKYIGTSSFEHTLIEINSDERWNSLLQESGGNNAIYSDVFIKLLDQEYGDYYWEFHQFIIPMVKHFLLWRGYDADDFTNLLQNINQLGVDSENVNALKVELLAIIKKREPGDKKIEKKSEDGLSDASLKNVFIVHGLDKLSLLELKEMLKEDFSLNPIILKDTPQETLSTIFNKLDSNARKCAVAIVLMTPDDEINGKKQPRPNVLLEFGYFLGLFPPDNRKIIVLRKKDCEIASDIHGVQRFDFNDSVKEVHAAIEKQLKYWKAM